MPPIDIQDVDVNLESLLNREAKPNRPAVGCPICQDRGMTVENGGIRYCHCPLGRDKKAEWLSFSAVDRGRHSKRRFLPCRISGHCEGPDDNTPA
jgi:hypothetical protein